MTQRTEEETLEQIRRAAFELRRTDPSRAVRELRRLARRGGEAEALAHGALGEILLEEFEDLDGAIHHFGRLLKIAPGIPAGELGLARALARQGDAPSAQEAYVRAFSGLEKTVRDALEHNEPVPGMEETILTMLEMAIEERELLAEIPTGRAPIGIPADILDRAERERIFDLEAEDDQTPDLSDWERLALLRGMVSALDGDPASGLADIERVAERAPLTTARRLHLRSIIWEAGGNLVAAAEEASQALKEAGLEDMGEVLRTSGLLRRSGRDVEARMLLERARADLAELARTGAGSPDELSAALDAVDRELAAQPAPSIVGLGLGRKREESS